MDNIEKKWQKKWEESKLFEANPDDRNKYFLTFPYPYINAYQHIGHMFTLMRVEALARYKRLQGFNVLFPQGWHATGSPIVNAAKRVAEKEEKQIKIMKDMGFSDSEIVKFEKPEYWIEFFAPEFKSDYQSLGMSVDWRRTFHTTSLNPYYDKFVKWQFNKLKEKKYVIQGKFPVVWDPKLNTPVGDHDRIEGEGVTTQDFIWGKFRMKESDLILMAGTTRPDAFYGQTHIWIDPQGDYVVVKVGDEKWVVGREALAKIHNQYDENASVLSEINPHELIGKWVRGPLKDHDIYTVPASFIKSSVGSGIVYSALEDPVDFFELKKIHDDMSIVDEFNLDRDVVAALKPISIINVPDMGDNLGEDIGKEFGITDPKQTAKIEEAKGELNRRVFRKGVMKENCAECAGMSVPDCQEFLKKELPKRGEAAMFYELQEKVVSRSLAECIVKVVDNQWFLDYGNEEWKKEAHACLDTMKLYPEKARAQFDYVIDWLHQWACTREEGLGSRLPWDEKWLIESLSDSTIYMAYYTIAHLITSVDIEKIDDTFFDYIFLGKGDKPAIEGIDEMRANFDYYYPLDFRNSGKDLIQNHLTFFIFNHIAIFPKEKWPRAIGANGWVTVDGQKMSKSLGNMIPVRDVVAKYSADASRITILNGGEEMDDPNWDTGFAQSIAKKLKTMYHFWTEHYDNAERSDPKPIDEWFSSKMNTIIKEGTHAMESTLFRTAIQHIYFEMQKTLKHYLKRTSPRKDLLNHFIESQIIMLTPFCPHLCEEAWSSIGKEGFVSAANWPAVDETQINSEAEAAEETLATLVSDISSVLDLIKLQKAQSITLITSASWKYSFYSLVKEKIASTRDFKEILSSCMANEELKKHAKDITKLLAALLKDPSKIPLEILSSEKEYTNVSSAQEDLKKIFQCEIRVEKAEESTEKKASVAAPGKPAILIS